MTSPVGRTSGYVPDFMTRHYPPGNQHIPISPSKCWRWFSFSPGGIWTRSLEGIPFDKKKTVESLQTLNASQSSKGFCTRREVHVGGFLKMMSFPKNHHNHCYSVHLDCKNWFKKSEITSSFLKTHVVMVTICSSFADFMSSMVSPFSQHLWLSSPQRSDHHHILTKGRHFFRASSNYAVENRWFYGFERSHWFFLEATTDRCHWIHPIILKIYPAPALRHTHMTSSKIWFFQVLHRDWCCSK